MSTGLDCLSGLHQRECVDTMLQQESMRALATARPLCVAVLEVDGFAGFLQERGREYADEVVTHLGRKVSRALHGAETVARYDGAQLLVLLPDTELGEALLRVDQLRQELCSPELTVSAGVASWNGLSDPAQSIVPACAALYLAHYGGGSRTAVVDSGGASHQLPEPLRDLQVLVQPIMTVAGNPATIGYECLSRFPHSTDIEKVFADAHRGGYGDLLEARAVTVGLDALRNQPAQLKRFVNVSERALRSTRFWDMLPMDLADVVVELVERRDGLRMSQVRDCCARLRDRGAQVALDDLVVEPDHLARIAALSPEFVKVDRTVITAGAEGVTPTSDLLRLVDVALAHGAKIVVEGVETDDELAAVRSSGAQYAQGYLLGRPAPAPTAPLLVVPDQPQPRLQQACAGSSED